MTPLLAGPDLDGSGLEWDDVVLAITDRPSHDRRDTIRWYRD